MDESAAYVHTGMYEARPYSETGFLLSLPEMFVLLKPCPVKLLYAHLVYSFVLQNPCPDVKLLYAHLICSFVLQKPCPDVKLLYAHLVCSFVHDYLFTYF